MGSVYSYVPSYYHTVVLWGVKQGCQLCKRVGFPCYPSSHSNPEISTICPFIGTQTSLATVITLNQLLVLACHVHNRDLQIAPCRIWWDGISYCSVACNGRQLVRQQKSNYGDNYYNNWCSWGSSRIVAVCNPCKLSEAKSLDGSISL